jgi:hypothetical protein
MSTTSSAWPVSISSVICGVASTAGCSGRHSQARTPQLGAGGWGRRVGAEVQRWKVEVGYRELQTVTKAKL